MWLGTGRTPGAILSVIFAGSTLAQASCPVKEVLLKGRVDHAPVNARVHVRLVYEKSGGESGEATIKNGTFSIALEFLTQSRRPVMNGMLEKCGRSPESVIVTLVEKDDERELDRATLDFARDFVMADPSAYRLRSELVLNGVH